MSGAQKAWARDFARLASADGARGRRQLSRDRDAHRRAAKPVIRAFTNDMAATRRSFVAALFALPIFVACSTVHRLAGRHRAPSRRRMPHGPRPADLPDQLGGLRAHLPPARAHAPGGSVSGRATSAAWNWSNLAQYALLFITALACAVLARAADRRRDLRPRRLWLGALAGVVCDATGISSCQPHSRRPVGRRGRGVQRHGVAPDADPAGSSLSIG